MSKIELTCKICNRFFKKEKGEYTRQIKLNSNYEPCCSSSCSSISKSKKVELTCSFCGIFIQKIPAEVNSLNYCSHSCAAKHRVKNRTKGTRRSKLEVYIEENLRGKYPNLEVEYNSTKAIGSELDIYIPSLNLAIELNGIFHYSPIFGEEKLDKIQSNDKCKLNCCKQKGITLKVIDCTKLEKLDSQNTYLNMVLSLLEK